LIQEIYSTRMSNRGDARLLTKNLAWLTKARVI